MGNESDQISTLSHQVAALVDRYNDQEDKIERLRFDLDFIREWINENKRIDPRLDYMGRI